jgi:SAM-dependent methyltransferase
MVQFQSKPWLRHHEEASSGLWKRILYVFLRPLLSWRYSRCLSPAALQEYQPRFCLGSRGMPLQSRRRWGSKYLKDIREAVVLVQGTGTGWDVISWAELRPRKIIATDMFSFADSWEEIARYCSDRYKVTVDFRVSPIEEVSFLDRDSVDFIVSDAVYEHCRDLPGVMGESFRILKPGGSIYATYGPLYYCAGGDHFSGRGGLETCYNHLRLEPEAYQRYLQAHQQEIEDFQGGARYIELKLFSYLTTRQYIKIFQAARFAVKEMILELSHEARRFKKLYPDKFNSMVNTYRNTCSPDDFLIKVNLIILKKNA